jgi:hypothetical protein
MAPEFSASHKYWVSLRAFQINEWPEKYHVIQLRRSATLTKNSSHALAILKKRV